MLKILNVNEVILVFKFEELMGVWVGNNNMFYIFKILF